jgi:PEP-CTERM motif
MRLKISVVALILSLAVLAAPRASFATTVNLTLESTDSGIYPYGFKVNGSGPIIDLSCLNDTRSVYVGETWSATVVNLETVIAAGNPVDGSSIKGLEEDAYLDSLYITNPSNPNYTLNNIEVQDAIWSILGTATYDDLTTNTEKTAVNNLITAAQNTSETSSFYSQFTFYYPTSPYEEGYGNEPQQFLGYTPSPTVTPEPSSLMLLGTGLLGGVGVIRRKLKKS